MYWSAGKIEKTAAVVMIFLPWIFAFNQAEEGKTLNLKIGFDLTEGKDGAPSLQIRNFEEFRRGQMKKQIKSKRAVRTDISSSESDEKVDDKVVDKVAPLKEAREMDASAEGDTSGSDDNRRLSTKGLAPDEFEPERAGNVHERSKQNSDSE